jgi:hypothetical protein
MCRANAMNKSTLLLIILLFLPLSSFAQLNAAPANQGGLALAPARFELEMMPGSETTVVVSLDYHAVGDATEPARIVASLNDWNITTDGRVEYFAANSRPNSASPWIMYSPSEAAVTPGTIHQIRVTITVPIDASPGDHLAALIIEQRPQTLKSDHDVRRQMIVRYRMASVFYIKVGKLTRSGDFSDLYAEASPDGLLVRPTLKNQGNSVIRPIASVNVTDDNGRTVATVPDIEPMPILAGSETRQAVHMTGSLLPGHYTIRYRVDFQDGKNATEGVTEVIIPTSSMHTAAALKPSKNP